MSEKQLLTIKSKIEQAKSSVSELTGRRKYLLQELREKWKCKTRKSAGAKLEEMEDEVEQLEDQIKKGLSKVEEKFDVF